MRLRLPSVVRRNPLVGWEDSSGLTRAGTNTAQIPLLMPNAQQKYAQVYNNVDLPIVVAIRGLDRRSSGSTRSDSPEADRELAERLNALVLAVALTTRAHQKGIGFKVSSPYTPFMLLHRLGDSILARLAYDLARKDPWVRVAMRRVDATLKKWEEPPLFDHEDHWYYDSGDTRSYLGAGIDTAAGRAGELDHSQGLSDLFAKYLLTGRIAYDPVNPPEEDRGVQEFRHEFARALPIVLPAMVEELRSRLPLVVNIGGS